MRPFHRRHHLLTVGVLGMFLTASCGAQEAESPPLAAGAIDRPLGRAQQPLANVGELMEHLSGGTSPQAGSRAAALVRRVDGPTADSPFVEQAFPSSATPPAQPSAQHPPPGASSPSTREPFADDPFRKTAPAREPFADDPFRKGAPGRYRFDDLAELRALPGVESRHERIGWFVNAAIDAFRLAIEQSKPLVLVVAIPGCRYCEQLVHRALRCPAVNRFAGEAVFAYSIPDRDKGATAIANSLNIEAYPTITVIEPDARMLLERGRINGFFEATLLGMHFETILWRTPPREYEPGVAAPAPVGPPPSAAAAEADARRPQPAGMPSTQCR